MFMRAHGFLGIIDLPAEKPDEKLRFATPVVPCDPAMAGGIPAGEEKVVLRVFHAQIRQSRGKTSACL
jgi:hypothetical protein